VTSSELRIPLTGPGISGDLVVASTVIAKLAGAEARATYGSERGSS
jgi:hypothetical protein